MWMKELALPVDHLDPFLDHAVEADTPVMLAGGFGIGKTEQAQALEARHQRKVVTKIFSAMSVEDICMAGPKPSTNFLQFLANEGMPFVGTEKEHLHPQSGLPPILFFDEITRILPYMQNANLQMFTERSFHGVPFIKGTRIIAAGNVQDAHIQRLSAALCNRGVWIYCDPPTLDGFKDYCTRHNVNPFVSAYADHTGGERIYTYNPEKFLVEPAFCTPRQWVKGVGAILDNPKLTDAQRNVLIGGAIGFGEGQDFEVFYRLKAKLPNIPAICAGQDQPVPENVSTKVLTINSLVRHATHQNVAHIFNYISKVSVKDPEYSDLFEKNLFVKDPTFAGNPAYTKWVVKMNRKPIVNAAATPTVLPAPPESTPATAPVPPQPPQPAAPSVGDILKSLPPVQLPPKRRI